VGLNDDQVRPEDIGAHYGFRRNPYDPTPLGMDEQDSSLFVAREKEGRQFRTFLKSSDSGGVFVEGGTGVGKTSFVHVQEYRCRSDTPGGLLLPTLKPIQLASTLETRVFLLSVLSNLLGSLAHAVPRIAKTPEFQRLSTAVNQTLLKSGGWQLELAGFGAGMNRDVAVAGPLLVLLSTISDLLDQAASLARRAGFTKVVVNVNNIEIVDARSFTSFLDVARDYTLTRKGFLWVFIGSVGSRATVAQSTRRVSELVQSDPVWLPPLSREDIHTAIDARIRLFRSSPDVRPPVSRPVIDLLYEASSGEMRYVLNRSRDLLTKTMIEFPTTREITTEIASPLLRAMTKATLDRTNLTANQLRLLGRLATAGPCQPRDFAKFGFRSAPAFLRYLLRFYALQLVDRRRRGTEVVYTPRGDVVLALAGERR
jgi:hypothetical protein